MLQNQFSWLYEGLGIMDLMFLLVIQIFKEQNFSDCIWMFAVLLRRKIRR